MGNCGSCEGHGLHRRSRRRSVKHLVAPNASSLESDRTDTTGTTLPRKPSRRMSNTTVSVQRKMSAKPLPKKQRPRTAAPKVKRLPAQSPERAQPTGGYLLPPNVRGWTAANECATEVYEPSTYISTDRSSTAHTGRDSSSEDGTVCTTFCSATSIATHNTRGTCPQSRADRISIGRADCCSGASTTQLFSPGRMEVFSDESELDFYEYNAMYGLGSPNEPFEVKTPRGPHGEPDPVLERPEPVLPEPEPVLEGTGPELVSERAETEPGSDLEWPEPAVDASEPAEAESESVQKSRQCDVLSDGMGSLFSI